MFNKIRGLLWVFGNEKSTQVGGIYLYILENVYTVYTRLY